MNYRLLIACATLAALFTACTSSIKPLQPIRRVEMWVPDAAGTQPATQTAATIPATTQVADGAAIPELAPLLSDTSSSGPTTQSTTQAATQAAAHPGEHLVVKVIDPNQTSRYIYHASYDNIWQHAMQLLNDTGFTLDRKDYRLGILTTQPLPSAQFLEPWKPQQTTLKNSMENTINMQQRSVRVTISKVPEKPDFYEIGIQVLVERQNNPLEEIGGPVFVEGSGFGRSQVSLRSDYAPADSKNLGPTWYVVGHDPNLEHKLLSELFRHI